jgi:fatty-acyl-CoA synthase
VTKHLTDWIEYRQQLTPDYTAVIDVKSGKRLSYNTLNQRAKNLAAHLISLGVAKGDRVALISPNHISYFDLIFACGKIGAIFIPLNWRLNASELLRIVSDCTPKMIALHSDMKEKCSDAPIWQTLVVNGEDYEQIVETDKHDWQNDRLVELTDPLMMIYSGGTTGRPKGVILSHKAVVWNAINTVVSWGLTSSDVTPVYLPMFHTGGINALTLPILHAGGSVVISEEFDAEHAIELLQQEQCTIVLMVPTMYHVIVQSDRFASADFSSVHTFISGGAPCPHHIYDVFAAKGIFFKEGYGLTEAGPNNFYLDRIDITKKKGSVGKPMMYNEVRIVKDDGRQAAPNEVGEIWLRGNHLFEGYWNNPDDTALALSNGWLKTGDLGLYDEDGFYFIAGRKKDMIISGGENIFPMEIEHWLCQHPDVNEAVVVGLPDQKWGEIVSAVLVLKQESSLTSEELKAYCSLKLGRYKIPKKWIFVDALEKTSVGKIDKKTIIKQLQHSSSW